MRPSHQAAGIRPLFERHFWGARAAHDMALRAGYARPTIWLLDFRDGRARRFYDAARGVPGFAARLARRLAGGAAPPVLLVAVDAPWCVRLVEAVEPGGFAQVEPALADPGRVVVIALSGGLFRWAAGPPSPGANRGDRR